VEQNLQNIVTAATAVLPVSKLTILIIDKQYLSANMDAALQYITEEKYRFSWVRNP
jgi:hypothetical protein